MDKAKITRWLYLGSTGLMCLLFTGTAIADLVGAAPIAETLARLGYPGYLMKILGVANLLGVAAIGSGYSYTLKEWAYAGFTINLIGAILSHIAAGDAASEIIPPTFALAIILVSYISWKRYLRLNSQHLR
jgi:DoxX-like protein